MRSPRNYELSTFDPMELSAIYSLATVGRERIVAGAAAQSLVKVFDLRISGGRAYSYLDISTAPQGKALESDATGWTQEGSMSASGSGWNIFSHEHKTSRGSQRQSQSPVYSLSRPSESSPSLYAGLENRVVHFNFTGALDKHPDPLFRLSRRTGRDGREVEDLRDTWYPHHSSYRNLAIYEHDPSSKFRLLQQINPWNPPQWCKYQLESRYREQHLQGYDERLVENFKAPRAH